MRAPGDYVALQTQLQKVAVDHTFGSRVGRSGGNMFGFEPIGRVPTAANRRVFLRNQTHHIVAKQGGLVHVCR